MCRLLLSLAAASLLASPSLAADADHDLLLRVKTAIATEPALKGVNLSVSVQDGVAVLWGQLPSDEARDSLLKAVRGVSGVSVVRADCWVPPPEDPLQAGMRHRLAANVTVKPLSTPSLPVQTPLSGTSAGYSPVPPPAPPAPDGPPQFPTIPSPRLPVAPAQDVQAAAEAVRASEPRFVGLRLMHSTGTITITGHSEDSSDAWALAARVRRVPGVEKVVVGRIITP